jgi:peptidyl-prolyl cis-trans isomerase SurA
MSLTALLLFAAFPVMADIVDEVLASVDKEVILRSDVMEELGPALEDIRKQATDEADFNRRANDELLATLNIAIENKILIRQAQLAGAQVDKDMLDKQIEDIRKRYKSNEEFLKVIEDAGETMSDFRERIRKHMLAAIMGIRKHEEFKKDAVISEADVAQYYQDNKEKFSHPDRARVRRIFLSAGSTAEDRARTLARLEEIRQEIEAGADFAQLAQSLSNGPEAKEGGMMGWVKRGDLDRTLEEAVFSLPEGGVTGVLESSFGYHIFKVTKKEAAGVLSFEEARKEIEPALRDDRAQERYDKWMDELRKRSQVRVFVRKLE